MIIVGRAGPRITLWVRLEPTSGNGSDEITLWVLVASGFPGLVALRSFPVNFRFGLNPSGKLVGTGKKKA